MQLTLLYLWLMFRCLEERLRHLSAVCSLSPKKLALKIPRNFKYSSLHWKLVLFLRLTERNRTENFVISYFAQNEIIMNLLLRMLFTFPAKIKCKCSLQSLLFLSQTWIFASNLWEKNMIITMFWHLISLKPRDSWALFTKQEYFRRRSKRGKTPRCRINAGLLLSTSSLRNSSKLHDVFCF